MVFFVVFTRPGTVQFKTVLCTDFVHTSLRTLLLCKYTFLNQSTYPLLTKRKPRHDQNLSLPDLRAISNLSRELSDSVEDRNSPLPIISRAPANPSSGQIFRGGS